MPLRIAFISHEFPPETGGGGIGTYLAQVSRLLVESGHQVEVFCGTPDVRHLDAGREGVKVHRIPCGDSPSFSRIVVAPFLAAHRDRPFDVIEGNDFDASALEIKRALPELAYVVKLHTPRFFIDELQYRKPSRGQRLRIVFGAWRRLRRHREIPFRLRPAARDEIAAIELAEQIAAPSQSIADLAHTWARIAAARIAVFPYPYVPSPDLLRIPTRTATNRVTFIGRLEERKGVRDLAAAIPGILRVHPEAKFRFVGRSMPAADGTDMQTLLRQQLASSATPVEFTGRVPAADIPRILTETDVVVAPSHWENSAVVCYEALAAGRAVVGSAAGGIAEILDGGRCGELVPPRTPEAITRSVVTLLASPDRRQKLGEAGRKRVLEAFSAAAVLPRQLACYEAAISGCRSAPRVASP
ncbi:MAG TPA: glycosyltransferase family 4 protein [Opitutaceae bacterium]|nr:glycosyltransferase family 4 protein [Opitutaceae bacterium]